MEYLFYKVQDIVCQGSFRLISLHINSASSVTAGDNGLVFHIKSIVCRFKRLPLHVILCGIHTGNMYQVSRIVVFALFTKSGNLATLLLITTLRTNDAAQRLIINTLHASGRRTRYACRLFANPI